MDLTLGYLDVEAKIGQTMTVSFGVTNLADSDLTLSFPSSQRFSIEVLDSNGAVIHQRTPPGGPAARETIAPGDGKYWTDMLFLDPAVFSNGVLYYLKGYLEANLSASATTTLTLGAVHQ